MADDRGPQNASDTDDDDADDEVRTVVDVRGHTKRDKSERVVTADVAQATLKPGKAEKCIS